MEFILTNHCSVSEVHSSQDHLPSSSLLPASHCPCLSFNSLYSDNNHTFSPSIHARNQRIILNTYLSLDTLYQAIHQVLLILPLKCFSNMSTSLCLPCPTSLHLLLRLLRWTPMAGTVLYPSLYLKCCTWVWHKITQGTFFE